MYVVISIYTPKLTDFHNQNSTIRDKNLFQAFMKTLQQPSTTKNPLDSVLPIDQQHLGLNKEFEFRPSVHAQHSLKTVQRLSTLTILLSIYQLVPNGLTLAHFINSFTSISSVLSAISLLLGIGLAVWATKVLKAEEHRSLLSEELISGEWEGRNINLFVSLLLRAAASFILIPNMLIQRSYANERMTAYGSTFNQPGYTTYARIIDGLTIPLPLLELMISASFLKAARTVFKYVKEPGRAISRITNLGNITLMASSLGLIFTILHTSAYYSHSHLANTLQNANLMRLLGFGVTASIFTFLIWLINHKKWRVPSLMTIFLMLALVVGFGVLTLGSYRHALGVQNAYGDGLGVKAWAERARNVDMRDFERFGCPLKYTPGNVCDSDLRTEGWEAGAGAMKGRCLNIACKGLLGGLYASPFMEISNFALVSTVSGMLIVLGGIYFWQRHENFINASGKKGYGGLVILGAMMVLFFGALAFYKKPYIHELNPMLSPAVTYQLEWDEYFGEPTNEQGGGLNVEDELEQKLKDFVFSQKYRYLIMTFDETSKTLVLDKEGEMSSTTYQDFVDAFSPNKPAFGLVSLKRSENQETFAGVMWMPESLSEEDKEVFSTHFEIGNGTTTQVFDFVAVLASQKEDLALENLYVEGEDEEGESRFLVVDPQRRSLARLLAEDVGLTPHISSWDTFKLFRMVNSEAYKYLVLDLDVATSSLQVTDEGDWDSSYDDFVANFQDGKAKLGLIYLDVEGTTKLVVVVFEDAALAAEIGGDYTIGSKLPNFEKLQEYNAALIIARSADDLKLENVVREVTAQASAVGQAKYAVDMAQLLKDRRRMTTTFFLEKQDAETVKANLQSELGESIGMQVFNMLTSQDHKYLLESYNEDLQKVEIVKEGEWSETYDTFLKQIDSAKSYVGFVYLSLEEETKPVMIIYVPESQDVQQTLQLYSLPKDPTGLEIIGFKVIMARNMQDLKFEKILEQAFSDSSFLSDLLQVKTSRMLKEDYGVGGGKTDLLNFVKDNKYVILRKYEKTNQPYVAKSAPLKTQYKTFVQELTANEQEQVALIKLKLETVEKLVLVVYSPVKDNKTIIQVLQDFGLPTDLPKLRLLGVSVYLAQTPNDLQLKKILKIIYTDAPTIESLIEQYELTNLLDSEDSMTCFCASCSRTASNGLLSLLEEEDDSERMLLWGSSYKGLSLKSDIIKPLKDKQYKYLILQQDPKSKKPYISNSGSWYATFDQFSKDFLKSEPQVGFIYLEVEGLEKLVMVVYAPTNVTEAQILQDFGVTKDPAKLQKNGINILVARSKEEISLNNVMNTVYGPGTTKIAKLIELIEEYTVTPMCNLMAREESMMLMFDKMGLDLPKKEIKMMKDKNNKYVIFPLNSKDKTIKTGTWHATFEQFTKDFDVNKEEIGFINLEIEGQKKMALVLYAPLSQGLSPKEVFKKFKVASSPKKLEKNGITPFIAMNLTELTLENVMNHTFNKNKPAISRVLKTSTAQDIEQSLLTPDIADALKNKKYKYVILSHNKKTNLNEVDVAGNWGATYEEFKKNLLKKKGQIAFFFFNIETTAKPIMVLYSPSTKASKVFAQFNLPEDVEAVRALGIDVYVARKKKDLELFKVLEGVYTGTGTSRALSFMGEDDMVNFLAIPTPLGSPYQGLVNSFRNKGARFFVLKRDPAHKTQINATLGPWTALFGDFVAAFEPNQEQIGFTYLGLPGDERIYQVVVAPGSADPKSLLDEFHIPPDLQDWQLGGVKTLVVRDIKEITLENLLSKSTPDEIMMLYTEQQLPIGKDLVDALNNKKYKYIILERDEKKNVTSVAKEGAWGSTYEDFKGDLAKKKGQLGFVYLDVEAKDVLVLVVYSPDVPGTQLLKNYGIIGNGAILKSLGIKIYMASSLTDLDLEKVLKGVHGDGNAAALVDGFLGF